MAAFSYTARKRGLGPLPVDFALLQGIRHLVKGFRQLCELS